MERIIIAAEIAQFAPVAQIYYVIKEQLLIKLFWHAQACIAHDLCQGRGRSLVETNPKHLAVKTRWPRGLTLSPLIGRYLHDFVAKRFQRGLDSAFWQAVAGNSLHAIPPSKSANFEW